MAHRSYLEGSFPLTAEGVGAAPQKPGAFAAGFRTHDVFTVQCVGRSDGDLRGALQDLAATGRYQAFKFLEAGDAAEAFAAECALFHEFGGTRHLDNKSHPVRPAGAGWTCPSCTIYGLRDWRVTAR